MAIVTSFLAPDWATLTQRVLRQAHLADLVELRLDEIPHPGGEALRAFFKSCPKPVIVTIGGSEAFGTFAGSQEERFELLRDAAVAGARFVDIDWSLSLELGEVEAPCHRIVSRHDLEGTPENLMAMDEEIRAVLYEGDAIKLVTHATCTEDGLRMLRHLRRARGGTIAFCSGPAGTFTRVLAPIFGSPFTYAAPAVMPGEAPLDASAPGQLRLGELLGILPPGGLSHETAVLGVVGRPVQHSASPFVHGMALKHVGLDAVYVAFEPDDFDSFLDLADDPVFRGLSVTAPFKARAAVRAKRVEDRAQSLGAVNTLVRRNDGSWTGANTDLSAVRTCLERAFGVWSREPGRPVGMALAQVLVLGTGGAARAAIGAAKDTGASVWVAGRNADRTGILAHEMEVQAVLWEEIGSLSYDILIHCTPVGSEGAGPGKSNSQTEGSMVIPAELLRPGSLVFDAVYRPLRTPLLIAAQERGCTCIPGAEWFVRQAAAQFELFTSHKADDALLRAAFEGALVQGKG
ncbi:MAG TPA: type I 3-dehydroquinate dehydratase [Planctomycetes bacterium]|nr:type I 3-dehydroquinate dehydratase [Planctomycetota bacterium]HIL38425.1 type I 3-dehydroquinate dehydratase [Planctomycetota bacterium]